MLASGRAVLETALLLKIKEKYVKYIFTTIRFVCALRQRNAHRFTLYLFLMILIVFLQCTAMWRNNKYIKSIFMP